MKKIDSIVNKYFWIIILIIGIINIWFISGMSIYQLGDAVQDNMLMVELADSMIEGEYLGEYNNNTLLKRISYPFFMATCAKLHIPYLTGLGILWVASVIVLVISLKKVIKNQYLLLLVYAFVLFNPAMFTSNFGQFIYRNAIVPSAVVLSIASLIGLYTRRNESNKINILWAIGSGISFGFFWNIREDSVWLLPFFAGALIITAIVIFKENGVCKNLFAKLAIMLLAVVCVIGINTTIKTVNYVKYGVYTDSELFDSNYSKLKSLLTIIQEEDDEELEKRNITVSRTTVNKLFEVSPTFAKLEPYMDTYMYKNFWQTLCDGIDDGEIYGGYFFWGLRDVVQAAGYYENGKKANDFYGDVYNEIMIAVDKGELVLKDPGFTVFGIDMFGDNSGKMIDAAFQNFDDMIDYEKFTYGVTISDGNKNNLRKTEILTGNDIIYNIGGETNIRGWIVPNDESTELSIKLNINGEISELQLTESMDVYQYYVEKGIENEKAKVANFSMQSNKYGNVFIEVYIDGELYDSVAMNNVKTTLFEDEKYEMFIADGISNMIYDLPYQVGKEREPMYNNIIKIYQSIGNIAAILAAVSLVALIIDNTVALVKKKEHKWGTVIILLGMMVSYIALIYGVSANYYNAIDSEKMWGYLVGTTPMQLIYEGIAISVCIETVVSKFGKM